MSDFVEVPLKVLHSQRPTTFPLHVRIDDYHIRYLKSGEVLSDSKRRMLEHNEPPVLWLHPDDLFEYAVYLSEGLDEVLDEDRNGPTEKLRGCYEHGKAITQFALQKPTAPPALPAVERLVAALLPLLERHGFSVSGIRTMLDKAPSLSGHSMHVCFFGLLLGHHHEYERQNELGCALLFHDIGKLELPKSVLDKKGELTSKEWARVRKHPTQGLESVRLVNQLSPIVRDVIQNHHERLDGSGYPRGLTGAHVSTPTRIASIVNTFDSRTSSRPYRPSSDSFEVLEGMISDKGAYDAKFLQSFVHMLST